MVPKHGYHKERKQKAGFEKKVKGRQLWEERRRQIA
jgi:hypothetical protein